MEEELQRTNMIKSLFIENREEISIVEKIEEFEDKIDYLEFSEEKKEKIRDLCEKIKKESEESREVLFNLLQKELNDQE